MKVLLVSPFFESPKYPLFLPSENLGLAYIASYLRKEGILVDIMDANMREWKAERIVSEVNIAEYGLVGIGVSSHLLLDEAIKISKRVKAVNNACHVNIGGHFATFQAQKVLEAEASIDSVVMRDGEETMLGLVRSLLGNKNLNEVLGLCFRGGLGNIIVNKQRPLVDNLDDLPWPSRDTLVYLRSMNHTWPTQISSSRGCYGNCTYCDMSSYYGRRWRARSAKDVVDEIEYLHKEYGSSIFRFSDDEFIGPRPYGPQRAREIANEILKRNLTVKLMIDARAQAVDKELFNLLKQSGVVDCLIGIESGVERILRLYHKGMTVKDNIRAIRVLKDLGISLNLAFIMIDPRMTFEELKENYRFLKENDIITSYSLKSWLWPLHGTSLIGELRSQGLLENEDLGEIGYRFIDSEVEKAFCIINRCKECCYPLEREIFVYTKKGILSENDLKKVLESEKLLWVEIFESLLNDLSWNDYEYVITEVEYQMDAIRKMCFNR